MVNPYNINTDFTQLRGINLTGDQNTVIFTLNKKLLYCGIADILRSKEKLREKKVN